MGIILSASTSQFIGDLILPNGTTFSSGTTELLSPIGDFAVEDLRASADLQSKIDSNDVVLISDGSIITNVSEIGINYISAYGGIIDSDVNVTGTVSASTISSDNYLSGGTNLLDIFETKGNSFSTEFVDLYDSSGGLTISVTTFTPVPLDAQREIDSIFSHDTVTNNDEVTINQDGRYLIKGRVSVEATSSGSRTQGECRLELDTGSGFVEVPGTTSEMYARQTDFGATGVFFAVLDVNTGDKVRMTYREKTGGAPLTLQADGSSLIISSMKAPKGDKGEAGSISNGFIDFFVTGTTFSDVFSGNNQTAVYYGDGSNLTGITPNWGTIGGDINNQTDLISLVDILSGGSGTYGYAEVQSNGTLVHGKNLSVNKTGVGVYEFTFDVPAPNSQYVVNVTFNGNASNVQDWTAIITDKDNLGFTITTTSEDNGGTADPPTDLSFELAVLGPYSNVPTSTGLPAGGTTGQVLKKNSNSDYDTIWSVDDNDITRVSGGSNILTGGTGNNPIINLADDISLNSINVTTITGGTIFSGSTNLNSLLGEDNTASNIGVGEGIFKQKNGVDLEFRSISGGTNTTVTTVGDDVVVDVQNPQVTEVSATGDTSTTSGTYILMDSMTITPAAGTYMVWFSSSGIGSNTNTTYNYAIFVDGSIISHTERNYTSGGLFGTGISEPSLTTQGLVTVNGSQAIEIRYLSGGGTFTIRERTLNIMKVN